MKEDFPVDDWYSCSAVSETLVADQHQPVRIDDLSRDIDTHVAETVEKSDVYAEVRARSWLTVPLIIDRDGVMKQVSPFELTYPLAAYWEMLAQTHECVNE